MIKEIRIDDEEHRIPREIVIKVKKKHRMINGLVSEKG
jgi:hypothetical protein